MPGHIPLSPYGIGSLSGHIPPTLTGLARCFRLVVILERRAFIHDLNTLELLDTLETAPNPKGICALSTDSAHHYLALPAAADTGCIL
eukprot:692687-Pyramimonas_sp.AAC.1